MIKFGNAIEWNGYSIFRVDESHYDALIQISKSAFGISTTHNYYTLKNNTGKFGVPDLGFIAYSQHFEPAAFYGVFACQIEYNGKIYSAAQSGDTMTHANHTGKGLFTKLADLTYELCQLNAVEFVFGFPNYNSFPGFSKKLNWEFPGNLNDYRLRQLTIPIAKLVKKVPFLKSPYDRFLNLINLFYSSETNCIKSSAITDSTGGVHRTQEFVKYKQLITRSKILAIGDARVWIKIDGFLFIGDIDLNGESFEKIIKKIKNYARIIGSDNIVFQTTEDSPLDIMFARISNSTKGLPWGYRNLNSAIDPSKVRYVLADFDTF